jgi:hypothetical protein
VKLSTKVENLKKLLKQRKHVDRLEAESGAGLWFSTSTWLLLGLCLAVAGLGTAAFRDYRTRIPRELIGLWEVEDGPQKLSTFEFFADGTLEVQRQYKSKFASQKVQIAVIDKTLVTITKTALTKEETKSDSIIRELTADTLILELENGDVLKMVRIE